MLLAPALLLCVVLQEAVAPAPSAARAVGPIAAEAVREHIDLLASDLLEGREAGTRGERRAAEYIVAVLERTPQLRPGGQDGSWFQPFDLPSLFHPGQSRNVLALLPGSDPALAGQTIVIGAHYDHEGLGGSDGVYNGADDNASGSAALLEIAAALAASPQRPRHTLLFQWFGAEEQGLLGSDAYIEHPARPLADTIFMLNLDMVGRLRGSRLMVGATGSSPLFPLLLPGLCRRHGLTMKDEPRVSGNSDHAPFFEAGVPVLFLFTGFHADYHRVRDESQRINADGVARIAGLAIDIVQAIDALEADERPAFVAARRGKEHWVPRLRYGMSLAQAPRAAGGLRVDAVEPDGPAARAGLRSGDVLLAIRGEPIRRMVDATRLLFRDDFEPTPVGLLVRRGVDAASESAPDEPGDEQLRAEELELLVLPDLL